MQPNIVITGFMGTGKSTIAPLVAERMNRPFVDTDDIIIERTGKSIPQIFAEDGEPRFRKIEADVCIDLAAQTGLVVATGGGALLNANTLVAMTATGMVVCLTGDEAIIEARLTSEERAGRPLAANWKSLYAERKVGYDAIPYQVDTSGKSPEDIAEEIIGLWQSVFK